MALLEKEIARGKRYKRPIALLVMDPQIGPSSVKHDALYPVLRKCGTIIRDLIRSLDIPGRFSNKLLLALPETTKAGALQMAQRIIKEFGAIESYSGDEAITVSTLVGLSMFPDEADTPQKLVQTAEEALSKEPIK